MTNTKTLGYIRVSTKDQNIERQLSKMLELGSTLNVIVNKEKDK